MKDERSTRPSIKRPFSVWVLIFLVGLLSLNGFVGGALLIKDPTGAAIGFPPDTIGKLPVPNFLLPGLFLFVVYGCAGAVNTFELVRATARARLMALALGIILMLWIISQVLFMGTPLGIQVFCFIQGVAIAGVAIMPGVKEYYRIIGPE